MAIAPALGIWMSISSVDIVSPRSMRDAHIVLIDLDVPGDHRHDLLAQQGDEIRLVAVLALIGQQDLQALARHRRAAAALEDVEQGHAALLPSRRSRKPLLSTGSDHRQVLALQPSCGLDIGARGRVGGLVERHRRAEIGCAQHALALRDDPEQRRGEDFENVVDGEHLAARGARRIVARHQDVLGRRSRRARPSTSWSRADR